MTMVGFKVFQDNRASQSWERIVCEGWRSEINWKWLLDSTFIAGTHAVKLACNPTPWEAEPEGLLLVQGHFMVPGQVRLHSEWNNGRLLSERADRCRAREVTAGGMHSWKLLSSFPCWHSSFFLELVMVRSYTINTMGSPTASLSQVLQDD